MKKKLENLLDIVCRTLEVDVDKVKSRSRKGNYIIAKQVFFRVAQGIYQPSIGKKAFYEMMQEMLKRDRTTILHYENTVETLIEIQDERFMKAFDKVRQLQTEENEHPRELGREIVAAAEKVTAFCLGSSALMILHLVLNSVN